MEKDKKTIIESLAHPEMYILDDEEIAALPSEQELAKVDEYLKHKFRNDIRGIFGIRRTRKDLSEIAQSQRGNVENDVTT